MRVYATQEQAEKHINTAKMEMAFSNNDEFFIEERKPLLRPKKGKYFLIGMISANGNFCGYY